MNTDTLILGANGMLGHALRETFPDATAWDRTDVDITDRDALRSALLVAHPSIIINAAAYTDVDGAEENEEYAFRVNGTAVGYLADTALHLHAVLVHFSTDYIFDGTQEEGYAEDDEPMAPVNVYGCSKLQGEQEMLRRMKHGLRGYLVRTSWLYGAGGKNFVDTIMRLGNERDVLQVVDDQHGLPTFTGDLAGAVRELVSRAPSYGIYHRTNSADTDKGITWHTFARAIAELQRSPVQVEPRGSEQYSRPAPRPTHSVLRTTKLPRLRHWREALTEYLARQS